jgi:hypothetical protein
MPVDTCLRLSKEKGAKGVDYNLIQIWIESAGVGKGSRFRFYVAGGDES